MRRRVALVLGEGAPAVSTIQSELQAMGATVSQTEYEKELDEKRTSVTFHLRYRVSLGNDKLLEKLEAQPGVRRVRIEPLT